MINDFDTQKSSVEFLNDIDNIIGVKHISNLMIGSLFNKDRQCNAIIQLFNCEKNINKHQVRRFNAIQGFLGGCLANIADVTKSVTTMIGIQMVMEDCNNALNSAEEMVESSLTECRNVFVPIDMMKKLTEYIQNKTP